MNRFVEAALASKTFPWRAARVTVLSVSGLFVLLMAFEDKLIYFPSRYPDGFWDVNDPGVGDGEVTAKVEDCCFKTSDGLLLHGWYCTPHRKIGGRLEPVASKKVLLWFHGNAGNLSHRYEMIRATMTLPVEVFIIDYRGYGRSEGKPSEPGLYLDARAAWDYLVRERRIEPSSIIIFGKSLGGAPAIDLASQVQPGGLIVQSSFTSAADMASSVLPFIPRFMLHTRMDSINKIAKVGCPKLFIHSRADEVVPYKLGRRLFEAAPEPKEFYEVAGAPHNSTYIVGGEPYLEALRRFINNTCD